LYLLVKRARSTGSACATSYRFDSELLSAAPRKRFETFTAR
jgi:hypothetical protein